MEYIALNVSRTCKHRLKMTSRVQNLNAQLCKHSYSEAVIAIARLASYATSRSLKHLGFGDYFWLAEELCKKDLILLSISIRRLAEMTKSSSNLKKLRLKAVLTDSDKKREITQENCWNIVGNIIHGVEIDVFKDIGKFAAKDIFEVMENKEEIDAALSVKSDTFHQKTFALIDLLRCLNTYLDDADDILAENKIFVGSLYE
ncbi:hypothetical protein KX729_14295 [Rhizobium sp. XQZ8]|uniref:hypothetical protein n=1 Tax=Rhizobium populisoli TaxID=2859785 RepID=UPI001CA5A4B6|nr:hypothetical protein [Rhizobium populisoli]MBW6422625.1 hypothetical protein [Rhizobium populisoli]